MIKFKKILMIQFFILSILLLNFSLILAQVMIGERISFPGIIENISGDFKFIVINEAKIYISSDTKILDENGNILKLSDLKIGFDITTEAIKNPNGFLAKRIVVKIKK